MIEKEGLSEVYFQVDVLSKRSHPDACRDAAA